MDLVHHVDVVDQLLRKQTRSLQDWQWSKQLRYYYVADARGGEYQSLYSLTAAL